jgi:hypothetical protein
MAQTVLNTSRFAKDGLTLSPTSLIVVAGVSDTPSLQIGANSDYFGVPCILAV